VEKKKYIEMFASFTKPFNSSVYLVMIFLLTYPTQTPVLLWGPA